MSFTDGNISTSQSGSSGSAFPTFQGFSNTADLNSSEGLLQLAQQQGGSVGQVADELIHPTRSILSTIGDGFKNAFKGFVDTISIPSEIVAGIISPDKTISEAINEHLRPSDVLMGQQDPNATTMEKVGGWFSRTAIDVLTDPLTYVTFGAGAGVFGLKATSKIALGEEAAAMLGKTAGESVALSSVGQDLLNKGISSQISGLKAAALKDGIFKELEGDALKQFVDSTINSKLDKEFIKTAMSRMLEKNPALTETLLDKGGIKFFGNTLLSGQRISSAIHAVPGFTLADQMTQPIRNAVGSLFNPAKTLSGTIPEETMNSLQKWKDIGEAQKSKMFNEIPRIWKEYGITAEEDNLIRAAVEDGKMPADPRLAEVWKTLKGYQKKNLQEMWGAGIRVTAMDNYIPHFLVDEPVKTVPFTLPPSQEVKHAMQANISKFIPVDAKVAEDSSTHLIGSAERLGLNGNEAGRFIDSTGKEYERVRATVEDAKSIGVNFDTSAISTLVKSSLNVIKGTTVKHMIAEVATKAGVAESKAPQGWVPIAIKGLEGEGMDFSKFVIGAEGEQLFFHPETAKRIENFVGSVINDESTNMVMKNFDRLQSLWKSSVTSIFPAFHGRNAISNVFLNYLDMGVQALNPTHHIMAADLLKNESKAQSLFTKGLALGAEGEKAKAAYFDLMTKPVFTDASGYEWSFGELRRVISEKNIAFNPNIVGSIDVAKSDAAFMHELFPDTTASGIAKKVLSAAPNAGRKAGNLIESQARLVNFVANLKNTGDATLAAQRTKQFLFDYGNLTNFEKTFLRRIMPFYTFTRKNLELQVKTLLTTPGRISNEVTALTTLGDVISGGKLTNEEQAALPDWIKSGIGILRSKKGSTVEILGSLGTPLEAPFSAFQPNQLLGSISPLIRVPVEQMSGYSFFQGKALSDVTNAAAYKNAPKAIQDFIGFSKVDGHKSDGTPFTWYVALRPERMNLLNNLPPTTRILTSLKQMQAVDVSQQDKIMQQLVGLRPYAFDIEQEAAKREAESKAKLEALLNKAGVIATFKRTFIPKQKL